jgi:hypothetical protein
MVNFEQKKIADLTVAEFRRVVRESLNPQRCNRHPGHDLHGCQLCAGESQAQYFGYNSPKIPPSA